jgi:hypothetical protein
MTVFNYSGFITFINALKLSIMKKIFKLFAALIFLVLICLSQPVKAQLSDAERLERCQNNKNRIVELETQLRVIDAELSQAMSPKEIEDARTEMVYVKWIKNAPNLVPENLNKFDRIVAHYNFNFDRCAKKQTLDMQPLTPCITALEEIIAQKIDKAVSLNRPALLAKKNETEKQLAFHRNNLLKWGCDALTTPDISGSWTSNIDVSYSISQTQSAFTWEAPKLHSKGEGTVTGNSISVTWTGDWGPGSATGTIKLDATGRATQIDWSNGVVFKRN